MAVKSSFWDFKGAVDYTDEKLFMGSPFPMLLILASYLFFVLRCGPKFMANRPAYELRKTLIVYNICQVVYCMYLFLMGIISIYELGLIENTTCFKDDEALKQRFVDGAYLYFLSKMSDFLDTIFFVLRKKWNQITFLHVYHHSVMYFGTWLAVKYDPSYSFVFFGTINCFVHAFMYSYYCLSAFPGLTKYLWWKKYITTMQLIQFMLVFIQVTWNFMATPCRPSYLLMFVIWFHVFLFIYLFTNFYIKSYTQKKTADTLLKDEKEANAGNGVDRYVLDKSQ